MVELLPVRAPYVGHAATRCYVPLTRNAGITRSMTRSFHIAREELVNPKFIFPNWAMNNAAQVDGYAGATIKVGVEYPIGTITLVNECVAAGNAAVPHPIGNTELNWTGRIPKGKAFFVRTYVVGPNGVVWTQLIGGNQSQRGNAPGEFCDLGTSDNDKVLSGTGSPAGALYTPIVIATQKRTPSVVIIGDSRPNGGAGAYPAFPYDHGPEARLIGPIWGYTQHAISASLQSQWNAGSHSYFYQLLAAGYWTHLINTYGTNDIGGGATAAVVAAARATCAAALKAQKADLIIIGETIYPYVSSSDVFVTKANQNIGAYNSGNQYRTFALNSAIRDGIAGEDFIWDIADGVDIDRTGRYGVSRDLSMQSRTPASSTAASISGTTLTVGGTVTGSFLPGDSLYDAALNIKDSTWIVEQLTGTSGGAGTYRINTPYDGFFPNPAAVASTTITTAGIITRDGLHLQRAGEDVVMERKGQDLITKIA